MADNKDPFAEFGGSLVAKDKDPFAEFGGSKLRGKPLDTDLPTGSQTSKRGFEPFLPQVPTKAPSVLTAKGQVGYQEQVKDFKPIVQKQPPLPKAEKPLSNLESIKNTVYNVANSLKGVLPRLSLTSVDVFEKVIGKDLTGRLASLPRIEFSNDGVDIVTGRTPEQIRNESIQSLDYLNTQVAPTAGIVENARNFNIPGLAAGVIDAAGGLVSTIIPSALSGGSLLVTEMVGGGLYDYNTAKAKSKGVSTEELYKRGDADFGVPAAIGGVGYAMERIGLKGFTNAISKKLAGSGFKKALLLGTEWNKEGLTEWVQVGLDEANVALANGLSVEDAAIAAADKMASVQGLEAYAKGFAGSAAASSTARGLKRLVSPKNKAKVSELEQQKNQSLQDLANENIPIEAKNAILDVLENTNEQIDDLVNIDRKEIEQLSESQAGRVGEINAKIEDIDLAINDANISESTKSILEKQKQELDSELDDIIATPEIKLAKPTFDTEEQIIAEGQQAEAEFKQTDDLVTYEQKMKELDDRAKNLVPAPEEEIGKPKEVVEIEPIRQLGTGANVYFETDKYRVNDELKNNKVLLNVQSETSETPIANIEFDNANDAVIIAKELNSKFPKGVPDAILVDKYIEQLKRDLLVPKPKQDAIQVEKTSESLSKQEDILKDVLELSDDDATVLSYVYNSNLTPEEKKILYRQWKRGVMSVGDIKRMTVIDLEKLKNEDIDKWAKIILERNKGKKIEAEDIDFEEIPKPKKDAVSQSISSQVPVLTEAPVGEEVEQGKPQAKDKVVTEEGKEEINPIDKDKGFDNPDFISYNGMFSKEKATSISQTDIIADEVQGAKGYHFFYKGKKSRIEMMSPDEYLKRVREGFKTNKDENILDSSKANINEGVEKGDKIDMPSLDYSNNSFNQEGRNRSLFAKERGEKLIPVLIIEDASMADRIAKAKEILSSVKTKENTTESLIQEAKNKFNLHRDAVEFMRRNIDEIKPELVQEKTPAQEVKRLRAKEQAELNAAIPNADQYLTNGKVDRDKLTDPKDLDKFDDIYDKYDKLITPLLPKSETKAGSVGAEGEVEFTAKGGNKVVDEKGNPLVLYHGTSKGLQAEDLKQSGQAGDYGEGIYFATDKREAEQRNAENIIEANVKSDKHLVIGSKEYFDGIYKTLEKKYGSVIPQYAIGAEAKKAGYTSIEVERPEGKWIIAFDGSKIQSLKETPQAEPTPAKPKAEPRLKPRVETRIKFTKAIELFNDISAADGAAKKGTLARKRQKFLAQNPSIKYIDDNWRKISDQLKTKGLIETKGNCP